MPVNTTHRSLDEIFGDMISSDETFSCKEDVLSMFVPSVTPGLWLLQIPYWNGLSRVCLSSRVRQYVERTHNKENKEKVSD